MSKDMPKPGAFCWNELITPDVKKAKEFYQTLFDWEYQEHDIGNMTYTMIQSGADGCGGGMLATPKEKKDIPPHWMNYIYVEKLDESVKKAEKLGAKVKVPATNVSDYGRFAIIEDPQGAHFGLWQNLKSCD